MRSGQIVIFIVLTVSAWGMCQGQDIKSDLKRMYEAYGGARDFYAKVEIDVFENRNATAPVLKKQAVMKKKGNEFLYTLDEVTMLLNEQCVLMINETEKDMVYTERTKEEKKRTVYDIVSPDLDSVIRLADSIVYKGNTEEGKHYVFYNSKSMIAETELYLDKPSYLIRKLVYRYNTTMYPVNNQVAIEYKEMNLAPQFEGEIFSEKNYVIRAGKELKPSPAYKNYHLISDEDENN